MKNRSVSFEIPDGFKVNYHGYGSYSLVCASCGWEIGLTKTVVIEVVSEAANMHECSALTREMDETNAYDEPTCSLW
jgi:hypothetical protein